jgi:chromosome segregation ATPase
VAALRERQAALRDQLEAATAEHREHARRQQLTAEERAAEDRAHIQRLQTACRALEGELAAARRDVAVASSVGLSQAETVSAVARPLLTDEQLRRAAQSAAKRAAQSAATATAAAAAAAAAAMSFDESGRGGWGGSSSSGGSGRSSSPRGLQHQLQQHQLQQHQLQQHQQQGSAADPALRATMARQAEAMDEVVEVARQCAKLHSANDALVQALQTAKQDADQLRSQALERERQAAAAAAEAQIRADASARLSAAAAEHSAALEDRTAGCDRLAAAERAAAAQAARAAQAAHAVQLDELEEARQERYDRDVAALRRELDACAAKLERSEAELKQVGAGGRACVHACARARGGRGREAPQGLEEGQ